MLPKKNAYNSEIPEIEELQKMNERAVTELLEEYLGSYQGSFVRSQQVKYFEAFTQGILSKLDRKSIEDSIELFRRNRSMRNSTIFYAFDGMVRNIKQDV